MKNPNINKFNETEIRASSETREVRALCDKLHRDLHAATLEAQGWKQEAVAAKAAVSPTPSFQYLRLY